MVVPKSYDKRKKSIDHPLPGSELSFHDTQVPPIHLLLSSCGARVMAWAGPLPYGKTLAPGTTILYPLKELIIMIFAGYVCLPEANLRFHVGF